jgi:hypothetical protein
MHDDDDDILFVCLWTLLVQEWKSELHGWVSCANLKLVRSHRPQVTPNTLPGLVFLLSVSTWLNSSSNVILILGVFSSSG